MALERQLQEGTVGSFEGILGFGVPYLNTFLLTGTLMK